MIRLGTGQRLLAAGEVPSPLMLHPSMTEHHLTVQRTARYLTLGPASGVEAVWFVLHGYGQLAPYFLRHFQPLDDGTRLIAAPEALSRFYIQEYSRVGASWMTKEARRAEIDDYLAYLDAVYDRLFADLDRTDVAVTLLGFSQGAATASRWAALGRARFDRLICWAGDVAHDLDLDQHGAALQPLTMVVGTEDEYITPTRLAEAEARFQQHDVAYDLIRFEGGHRLDAAVLKRLAS